MTRIAKRLSAAPLLRNPALWTLAVLAAVLAVTGDFETLGIVAFIAFMMFAPVRLQLGASAVGAVAALILHGTEALPVIAFCCAFWVYGERVLRVVERRVGQLVGVDVR